MEVQLSLGKIEEVNSSDVRSSTMEIEPFNLPFTSRLCFLPLIERIEKIAEDNIPGEVELAREVLKKVNAVPALRAPFTDTNEIKQHQALINLMLLFLIPVGRQDSQLIKISSPFRPDTVYATPPLVQFMAENETRYVIGGSDELMFCASLVRACSLILNKFYNQHLEIDPPISVAVKRKDNPLESYYKIKLNLDFIDIKALKPIKPLSQDQIDQLLANIYDSKLWLEYIPVENFAFDGFVISEMIDITEEEALSRLKHSLLRRDAVVSQDNILELQGLLRTYFDIPELCLGLTAIDYPRDLAASHQYKIRFNLLADFTKDLMCDDFSGSIYERACEYREMLLIEDLKKLKDRGPLEEELLRRGIRSIIVAPLLSTDQKVIGLVEIASPQPYEMHSFIELKFQDIRALFRTSLARSRDEVDNRLEAIMREQFTALHPSVEWRFMDASFNLLEQRETGERGEMEAIHFRNVYPLYGQADIVDSSIQRNEAIKADLIANLEAARTVLLRSTELIRFPLVNQVLMRLERDLNHLGQYFNSSDETRVIEFLFSDIHPLLKQLHKEYRPLTELIDRYYASLDEEFGIVYDKRKDYETSVAKLNNSIARYLDEKQEEMQAVLPHYFEKYKTDGVEYEIYLGQSLLKRNCFSDIHLRNFRLWQIIHMCEITRLVADLGPKMAVPLTTAQLIFAYTNTLSILFRTDEKRFDVEGAYNVRYEILKKRIDKALIEGTDERLTQQGQVAIVYLQEKDKIEYLDYLHYLQHEGYIDGEIEDLQLSALQGVQGLRALRFKVKL